MTGEGPALPDSGAWLLPVLLPKAATLFLASEHPHDVHWARGLLFLSHSLTHSFIHSLTCQECSFPATRTFSQADIPTYRLMPMPNTIHGGTGHASPSLCLVSLLVGGLGSEPGGARFGFASYVMVSKCPSFAVSPVCPHTKAVMPQPGPPGHPPQS